MQMQQNKTKPGILVYVRCQGKRGFDQTEALRRININIEIFMSRISANLRRILPDKNDLSPNSQKVKYIFTAKQFFNRMSPMYDKYYLLICFFFLICSSFAEGMIPRMLSKLIDLRHERDQLISQLQFFLAVVCLTIFLVSGRQYFQKVTAESVKRNLRTHAFNCFVEADLEFFDENDIGALLGRISNDSNKAEACSTEILFEGVCQLILFITSFCSLLLVSIKMSLILIAAIPLTVYVHIRISKIVKKLAKKYNKITSQSQNFIQQRFSNILTIAAFKRQEAEIAALQKFTKDCVNNTKAKAFYGALAAMVNTIIPTLSALAALYTGMLLMEESELTFGNLMMFLLLSRATTKNALKIGKSYAQFTSSMGNLHKFFKLLNYKPKIKLGVGIVIPPLTDFKIEFEHVGFHYSKSETLILNKVDLTIKSGEYVGVVGLSGSGKSSLLKVLLRIYEPTSGRILLNGADIKQFIIEDYHKFIGYVSQEPILFSGTIEDNILYGKRDASPEELQWALKMAGINFLVDFPKGIKTKIGDRGAKLSGGQKQRVCIARALIRHPKIIVFDEATSALDVESSQIVQSSIEHIVAQNIKNNLHLTVIVITHQLETLKMADRIVVMEKGSVASNGDHETVLKQSAIYRNLIHGVTQGKKALERKQSNSQSLNNDEVIEEIEDQSDAKKSDQDDD